MRIKSLLILISFIPSITFSSWWDSNYPNRRVIRIDTDSLDSENLTNVPIPHWWTDSLDASSNDTNRAYVYADDSTELWADKEDTVDWVLIPQIDSTPVVDSFYIYYGASSGGLKNDSSEMVFDTANGYAGGWHLDETSGGHHFDVSYNSNDDSCHGGVIQDTTGLINGGDYLDGSDDFIDVPEDNSLDMTTTLVAEILVNIEALASNKIFMAKWHYSTQGCWTLGEQSGEIRSFIALALNDPGNNYYTTTDANMVIHTWYYIVMVYNGGSQTVKIYLNSRLLNGDVTGTIPASLQNSSASLKFGKFGGSLTWHPNCRIDEVRVSNTLRSAEWIQIQYLAMTKDLLATGEKESASVGGQKDNLIRGYLLGGSQFGR